MDKSKFLSYSEMNYWTKKFNQQGNPETLVNAIKETAKTNDVESLKIAKEFCYGISLIFDLWFKGKQKDNIKIKDIFNFMFDNLFFVKSRYELYKPGSFQIKSSLYILSALFDDGMIDSFELKDIDFGKWVNGKKIYTDEARKKAYNKLINRMNESDFHCARVCFGQDASSDHAIIVTKDIEERFVVVDTSYRSHSWPENDMYKHITEKNIIWFTEII